MDKTVSRPEAYLRKLLIVRLLLTDYTLFCNQQNNLS